MRFRLLDAKSGSSNKGLLPWLMSEPSGIPKPQVEKPFSFSNRDRYGYKLFIYFFSFQRFNTLTTEQLPSSQPSNQSTSQRYYIRSVTLLPQLRPPTHRRNLWRRSLEPSARGCHLSLVKAQTPIPRARGQGFKAHHLILVRRGLNFRANLATPATDGTSIVRSVGLLLLLLASSR